jgi:hypothetical protein
MSHARLEPMTGDHQSRPVSLWQLSVVCKAHGCCEGVAPDATPSRTKAQAATPTACYTVASHHHSITVKSETGNASEYSY